MKSFRYVRTTKDGGKKNGDGSTASGAAVGRFGRSEKDRGRKKTARTVAPLHCYVKWLAVPLFYLQILSLIIKPPHILHVPHPRSSPCEIN